MKLTLRDCGAIEALLEKAFPGINPAGIVEREVALAPETCFMVLWDGEAVGMVCAIQYDQLAYIGPMAIAPAFQGRGLGRRLFDRLVETLESRGSTTMLLDATEAGEPLYRQFGFGEAGRTFDMVRTPGPGIAPIPACRDLELVLEFDRGWFGANRDAIFRRFVEFEGAALYSDPGGYLMAQLKLLGPFAASHRDAAERLIDHALSEGAVAGRVLAPAENPAAERLLISRGFKVQREVKHMRRGASFGMRRDLMYGLASFALG